MASPLQASESDLRRIVVHVVNDDLPPTLVAKEVQLLQSIRDCDFLFGYETRLPLSLCL